MKICLIETFPIVETQLFYESDFSKSAQKKSVFFLTISIILSENRPWTRKNQFSQLCEVLSISNLFHR